MELKFATSPSILRSLILLIVPYGIEICDLLTIVPCSLLLIVPYGIEIIVPVRQTRIPVLLIVPYGIEMWLEYTSVKTDTPAFNRTLWN